MTGSEAVAPAHRYDVVVVSYNQRERLLAGLASAHAAGDDIHLIVVDNASRDESAAAVRESFPDADLLALDHNIGFGPAVNRGAARGTAPYILLLNNDARLRGEQRAHGVDRVGVGGRFIGPVALDAGEA